MGDNAVGPASQEQVFELRVIPNGDLRRKGFLQFQSLNADGSILRFNALALSSNCINELSCPYLLIFFPFGVVGGDSSCHFRCGASKPILTQILLTAYSPWFFIGNHIIVPIITWIDPGMTKLLIPSAIKQCLAGISSLKEYFRKNGQDYNNHTMMKSILWNQDQTGLGPSAIASGLLFTKCGCTAIKFYTRKSLFQTSQEVVSYNSLCLRT